VSAAPAPALTHECPAPACTEQVDPDVLMCPRHWYQVPKPLRRAVWVACTFRLSPFSPRARSFALGKHAAGRGRLLSKHPEVHYR
jgi:hypothetical protein